MDHDNKSETNSTQESSVSNKGSLWQFLDWIEEIIWRMIIGVIRFVFRELPEWLVDILKEWFPTFTKFLKVTFLLITLVIIAIGPAMYAYLSSHDLYFYSDFDRYGEIVLEPWLQWTLYGWTTIAVLGALWGVIHIKIRRKGKGFLKAAIRTLFGKKMKMILLSKLIEYGPVGAKLQLEAIWR